MPIKKHFRRGNAHNCKTNLNFGKQGSKHPAWKDNPGYSALHLWVIKNMGKARVYICQLCHKKPAEHWINKRHDYKRELSDYIPACAKCHYAYDKKYNGRK
jgi:hypothetical protein